LLILAVAFAMLLAAGLKVKVRPNISRIDRKELARHRRASDAKRRDWMYPFE
jgi:hypothetical protein